MDVLVALNQAVAVLFGWVGGIGLVGGIMALIHLTPEEIRARQQVSPRPRECGEDNLRVAIRAIKGKQSIWSDLARRWNARPYARWMLFVSLGMVIVSVVCSEVLWRIFGPAFRV